jgi:AcrR family transcriptional regulator
VSDIAREAGVSKGAVYLHWESKDDLFEALIYRESERVVDDLLARIEADPEAGTVFSLYQYSILAIIENPLMHAVMTQDIRVMGDFSRRWVQADKNRAAEAHFMRGELVKQLQAAHVIRADLDAEVIGHILAIIRYGILTIHQIVLEDETPPLEIVGKTLGLMLERALAPEDGPDREAGKAVLEHLLGLLRQWVQGLREPKDT